MSGGGVTVRRGWLSRGSFQQVIHRFFAHKFLRIFFIAKLTAIQNQAFSLWWLRNKIVTTRLGTRLRAVSNGLTAVWAGGFDANRRGWDGLDYK